MTLPAEAAKIRTSDTQRGFLFVFNSIHYAKQWRKNTPLWREYLGRQDELYIDPFLTESESSKFRRAIGRVRHPSQNMGDEKNEPAHERLARVREDDEDEDILRRRRAETRRVEDERVRREEELAGKKDDERMRRKKRDEEELMRRAAGQREREKKARSDDWERKGLGQPNTPDHYVRWARHSSNMKRL